MVVHDPGFVVYLRMCVGFEDATHRDSARHRIVLCFKAKTLTQMSFLVIIHKSHKIFTENTLFYFF